VRAGVQSAVVVEENKKPVGVPATSFLVEMGSGRRLL